MTFELGRMSTCRLPAFSALLMLLRASLRTEVLTILAVGDSQVEDGNEVSIKSGLASMGTKREGAPMNCRRVLQLESREDERVDASRPTRGPPLAAAGTTPIAPSAIMKVLRTSRVVTYLLRNGDGSRVVGGREQRLGVKDTHPTSPSQKSSSTVGVGEADVA